MDSLTLRQRVDTLVNNASKEIIVGVYLKRIDAHNEFCECDYCAILKQYVRAKKSLCRMKRDYYRNDGESQNLWDRINRQKDFIRMLKQQKDTLKLKLH